MTKPLRDRLKDMDAKQIQEWKADLECTENRTKNTAKNDLESLLDVENAIKRFSARFTPRGVLSLSVLLGYPSKGCSLQS